MKPLALLVVAAIALGAQDSPGPTFEVASVRVWQGDSGPPTSFSCKIDPAIFRCSAATLRTLLTYGYGVQSFQIEGPAWIDQEYYDISAKFPAGVTREQLPEMMQRLLAERFALKAHRESKQVPGYELTVAKGGPKLKKVDASKPAAEVDVGALSMGIKPNGAHTMRGNLTMANLATHLTGALRRPVADGTGIAGIFEIELTYFEEDVGRNKESTADSDSPTATIFQALQQTLGLRLEAKKVPIEMLVIDGANRIPAAN
jgi:uncharacterized protein (TIGR03435 family)